MNCASVLEALLVAEPSELAAEGNTALAIHLHSCERCRRLAGQLLIDTRLLSTAMQASRVAHRRSTRPRYVLAPVGLVATLLVVAVLRTPGEVAAPTIKEVVVTRTLPAPVIRDTEPAVTITPIERATPATRARLRSVRAFPSPLPVAPVRFEPFAKAIAMAPVVVSPTVAVDPPAGTRAAVLHTSNPKLVVVWLY